MIWKPVPEYVGLYECSDHGDIRSLDRVVARTGHWLSKHTTVRGRVLKLRPHPDGYCTVNLCRDGTQRTVTVHSIICHAFHGPRPPGLEVCHSNGIESDNRASNLRWGTHAENEADKFLHGTRHRST